MHQNIQNIHFFDKNFFTGKLLKLYKKIFIQKSEYFEYFFIIVYRIYTCGKKEYSIFEYLYSKYSIFVNVNIFIMNNQMTIEDYCSNINGLRFITRFQGVSRTHDESVAEHSFFVAAFVYKLADLYKFDLNKTLKAALMHDCAEVEVSDVPYVVKKANPALAIAVEAAELDTLSKKVDAETLEVLKDFNNENEAETPEGLIIALADALEVVEYARTEATAGNEYMKQCFLNGNKRVEKLKTLLEPYKRTVEAEN